MELKRHPDKVGRGDFIKLPPGSIKIDPNHNIRDMKSPRTREHIEELKISIRAFGGIKDPFEVRMVGDECFVTGGECRLTAVLEMIRDEGFECEGIACIKEPAGTDEKERLLNFGVSGTKERYNELEMAEWCRRCERANIPHEKIAAAAGWKSVASVKRHLDMLSQMPEPIKEMVGKEEVSATEAMKEIRADGPEAATQTLKEAKHIADSEGKKKVTRKTIDQTKNGRRKERAIPFEVPQAVQQINDTVRAFARIAIIENVKAKADDEMVHVPASVLKAALARQKELDGGAPVTNAPLPTVSVQPEDAEPITFGANHAATVASTNETLSVLIDLTHQAHLCVQHNQSEEHPGWWSSDLVEAIRKARDVVERLTGEPMQLAVIADAMSQEEVEEV